MRLLVLGSTGTLGSALLSAALRRGLTATGAARRGAPHVLDVSDGKAIETLMATVQPTVVVNCVAITDLQTCESDPASSWLVNARAPGLVASAIPGTRFLHVSTDHFFSGDGRRAHDESHPVTLVNEYARAKFAAETQVLSHSDALVVRTNVVGWRGWAQKPTFVEWASSAIDRRETLWGFDDYFTSSIDAHSLADTLIDLAMLPATGVLNVASAEVASKFDFIRELTLAMGGDPNSLKSASVRTLSVRRAESSGLDVSKAQRILGRQLPSLSGVVRELVESRPVICAS